MQNRDDEIRALKDRLAKLEGSSPSSPRPPQHPGTAKGCVGFVIFAVVLVLLLLLLGMCTGGGSGTTDTHPEGSSAAAWLPPEDYSLVSLGRGGRIGAKWETPKASECRGSGVTCFALDVITENGCPRSLYASITLLDGAGGNIGWTNDTAMGVQPNEPVRLIFRTYERGADTARIAEINCY